MKTDIKAINKELCMFKGLMTALLAQIINHVINKLRLNYTYDLRGKRKLKQNYRGKKKVV